MRKESLLSSMPKLILAVVLIVCIGTVMGLMGCALTKKQTRVETPEVKTLDEIVENETINWQTYSNPQTSFIFEYPKNWEITEDYFYETATGIKAKNRTVIVKLPESENSETININMPQAASNYNPETCKYKDLCKGNYVATCGKELKTIEIYHQVVNSFQCVGIEDETADWQTYRNEEYGFEVKYPKNAILHVSAKNISEIEDMPLGYDKKNFLDDKAALEKNDPTVHFRGARKSSYEIVNIPGALSKKFTTLRVLDVCDVQFTREALIYKDNYLIELLWRYSNVSEIINNNPDYFVVESYSCGDSEMFKDESNFYKDLVLGKTDTISQKWFNDFNQILSTFKFIEK